MTDHAEFKRILVATDFSPHSEAAFKQGIWLARQCKAQLALVHVLPDLRRALLSASSSAQLDIFFGEGDRFQQEIREDSTARMLAMIGRDQATDLGITCETILGDPSVAITHAVQQEKHDLVIVGTRGRSVWEKFFIGSVAKRLIRNCPCPVWTVKAEHIGPPKIVLTATDFSDTSRRAVLEGLHLAERSAAEFHLLHVIDSRDVPDGLIERVAPGHSLREEIHSAAQSTMADFVKPFDTHPTPIRSHLSWGIPAQEIARIANQLQTDLLVVGTIGRSGIKGVVLGNTAEKILDTCDCSILAVKPEGFVSPIDPPFWPLHPASPIKSQSQGST